TFSVKSPLVHLEPMTVTKVTLDEAKEAADTVVQAFPDWEGTTIRERAELLERWAGLLERNSDDLAGLITKEMGKPIRQAKAELNYAISFPRTHARGILGLSGRTIVGKDRDHRALVSYK